MKRKASTKLLAMVLVVLMALSGLPLTVAYADPEPVTAIASAQDAGTHNDVTLAKNQLAYTITGDEVVTYNGTTASLDVKIKYTGEGTVTAVTAGSTNIADTLSGDEYSYTVEFNGLGTKEIPVEWTVTKDETPTTVDETLSVTLTEANVIKYSVDFTCGSQTKTVKYTPGQKYSDKKTVVENEFGEEHYTLSYSVDMNTNAADGTTVTVTKARSTFDFSGVPVELDFVSVSGADLSGVHANLFITKSTCAGEADLTNKAYEGGETTFDIALDDNRFKVIGFISNTSSNESFTGGVAKATFSAKPSQIIVVIVLNEADFSLSIDGNKHFKGVDEEVAINVSPALPDGVELEYTVTGSSEPLAKTADGKYKINTNQDNFTITGTYKYQTVGVDDFVITKTNVNFSALGFTYESADAANDPVSVKNVNGKLYFKNSQIVVNTTAAIKDKDGYYINLTTNPITLGQGKYTSNDLADVAEIYIDNVAPTISVTNEEVATVASTANFAAYAGAIEFTVTEETSGIDTVTVTFNESNVAVTDKGSNKYSFDTAANGVYSIVVTDKAGNVSETKTIDVKNAQDTTKPVIGEITPPTAATKADTQDITVPVTENQSGFAVSDVTITAKPEGATATVTGATADTVTFTVSKNGTYSFTVKDIATNTSETGSFTVSNFDLEAPSAALNAPTGNSFYDTAVATIKGFFFGEDDSVDLELTVSDVKTAGEADEYSVLNSDAFYYVYNITDAELLDNGQVSPSSDKINEVKANMQALAADPTAEISGYTKFNPVTETPSITLTYGAQLVFVYASDAAGNELFAYSDGFVFDDGAPDITAKLNDADLTDGETVNLNKVASYVDPNSLLGLIAGAIDTLGRNHPTITIAVKDNPVSGEFVSGLYKVTLGISKNGGVVNTTTLVELDKYFNRDTAKLNSGTYEFDFSSLTSAQKSELGGFDLTDDGAYTFIITAYDMCGNKEEFTFSYNFDKDAPIVSDLTYAGGTAWSSSGKLTVKVSDKNPQSFSALNLDCKVSFDELKTQGLKYAVVSATEAATIDNETADSFFTHTATADDANEVFVLNEIESTLPDGEYDLNIAFRTKDINENTTTQVLTVHIKHDTVAPSISGVELYDNTGLENTINKLTFGLFCKNAIKAKLVLVDNAPAVDAEFAGKVTIDPAKAPITTDDITVSYDSLAAGADAATANTVNASGDSTDGFYIILPLDTEAVTYTLKNATVKDAANNADNDNAITQDNTYVGNITNIADINNAGIMVENKPIEAITPTITATKSADVNGKTYYSKDLVLTYTVSDADENNAGSGLNSVIVNANGTEGTFNYSQGATNKVLSDTFTYTTATGEVTSTEGKNVNGTYADDDNAEYKISITADDNAWNAAVTNSDSTTTYYVDSLAPRVTAAYNGYSEFTSNYVEIRLNVTDDHFNGENGSVVFTYDNNNTTGNTIALGDDAANGVSVRYEKSGSDKFVIVKFDAEGKFQLTGATVSDIFGNETVVDIADVDDAFTIDRTAPTITEINFSTETTSFMRVLRGIFAKEKVTVTVTVENTSAANLAPAYCAPVDMTSAKLFLYAADNKSTEFGSAASEEWTLNSTSDEVADEWTFTYDIPVNTQGRLKINLADQAANALAADSNPVAVETESFNITFPADTADKDISGQVYNNFFLLETVKPSIDIADTAEEIEMPERGKSYTDADGNLWFNDDVVVPVKVIDDQGTYKSGVYSVEIKVNDTLYNAADGEYDTAVWTRVSDGLYVYNIGEDGALNLAESTFKIDTAKCNIEADASYKIDVKAIDFATNEETATFTLYKDIEAPSVTDFTFDPITDDREDTTVSVIQLSGDEIANGQGSEFAYYFNADTKVTVSANELNDGKNKNPGIKSITFYTVDYSNPNNPVTTRETSTDIVDNAAEFTVKANFKGQVFAYATDFLDNSYHTAKVNNDTNSFERTFIIDGEEDKVKVVVPYKTVLETQSHHDAAEAHIVYDIQTKTSYKDAASLPLYNSDVNVKITVSDLYAGIRSGKITIYSDENRENELSEFDFEVTNAGEVNNDWTIDSSDENLVTSISKVFTVKRDSNNIYFTVEMTDRAGNTTTTDSPKFSIDKTAPKVVVSYDNNSASEGEYFKAARTATITVTERNFDPSLFNVMKNGSRVNVSWTPSTYNSNTNKEGTVYTAKLPFNTDGHYTFSVNGVDRVNNKATVTYTGTAPTKFTVDLTDPVVTVAYTSTVQPANTNYYKKPVTATITVVEHNWNPDKFVFYLKMNDGAAQQTKLTWSNSGDTHTATFVADSVRGDMYTLDFTCIDRAGRDATFRQNGNNVKDYRPETFFVDQTPVSISYAFNGTDTKDSTTSTTNSDLAVNVSLSDTYYDYVIVDITGAAHNFKRQDRYSAKSVDIASIIENISADNKLKDDFYTVKITAYDKAGNDSTITRYFALNRNGSIFTFNTAAEKLVEKKYTNSKNDLQGIAIYEKNIDPINLSKSVLQLSINGKPVTLKVGEGYTVNSSSERGADGYYTVTYTLDPSIFADDATYKLLITSQDNAGNTSKNSEEEGKAIGADALPILAFIHDETAPTIDINLDVSKKDGYYSIAASEYVVTFTPLDVAGSGIDYSSVTLTIGSGDKAKTIYLGDEEYQFTFDEATGTYSFVLKGNNNDVTLNYQDKAGNHFEELIFKHITVSSNALERFFYNTPLFVGVLVGIVVLATGIIIFIAKRKKKDDDEEDADSDKK